MSGPALKLLPSSTPGVMAAKLLMPWGSGCDAADERGSHQLLASCLSRGCGPLDHLQLADLVEGRGAGLRSEANEDGLLISLRCTLEDADALLPLLGWMVTSPSLEAEQVELERSLSLQALQRQKEDPFQVGFDAWRQLVYGDGPYGHDPLGIRDDLEKLTVDRIRSLATQLPRGHAVLVLAGQWPDGLEKGLTEHLGWAAWSGSSQPSFAQGAVPWQPKGGSRITTTTMETEQVVITLGQPCCAHGHPDDLALRLLQCHLGSGMSSLLFRRLREEHGVAYDVGAHLPARAGASPFVLHASSSADRAELALSLLQDSWQELSHTTLTESELDLARAKFRGQIAHGGQTCSQKAERCAQLHSFDLPEHHDQICLDALDTLGPEQLRQAAQRWLQHPHLSLCGPGDTLRRMERCWERDQSEVSSCSS